MKNCILCNNPLKRKTYKYCSNKCQKNFEYRKYIDNWRMGILSGNRGVIARNISQHIRRYLIEKFEEKCSSCGWNLRNPVTRKVPLEIDHINGNAEDTREENLRLICPNCHSLSPTFRNLNKGSGRAWRQTKHTKTS